MNRGQFATGCLLACLLAIALANPAAAGPSLSADVVDDIVLPGEVVQIRGMLDSNDSSGQVIYIQIYDPDGDLIHQDLVDTITDENGNYAKDWILPLDAKSGIWDVKSSWSENVLVSAETTFRVGELTLTANVTGAFTGDGIQFQGILNGSQNAGQDIYFQIFDAHEELVFQRLSGLTTNATGHFTLNWTVPETTAIGVWHADAAWAVDRILNDTFEFHIDVVDTTPPSIDHPPDVEFGELGTENLITWSPYDTFPENYSIYRNGSLLLTGPWNSSSETISASAVGLPLGVYNYTIVVFDYGGNSVSDTVMVTISDLTPPSVLDVADLSIPEGFVGAELVWNGSDLHPDRFEVWVDNIMVDSGPWNSSSEAIGVALDDLAYGNHSITVVFIDESHNEGYDTALVNVYDGTPPEIEPHPDVIFSYGELGHQIEWNVFDLHPSAFTILRNGSLFTSGLWNSSSENISISLNDHSWGTYNYTLIVEDIDSNQATDQVIVKVEAFDETPPEISHPSDIEMAEGASGYQIVWNGTDDFPMSYTMLHNSTELSTGLWNTSSEFIIVLLDGLGYGVHNFTLILSDVNSNSASDTVIVSVFDGTPPVIYGPDDIDMPEGETGYQLTWNVSDLHPDHILILRNGAVIATEDWADTEETFSHSLDGLLYGTYNFTLAVFDIDGNTMSDTVFVTVFDATAPSLDGPDDMIIEELQQGQVLVWTAYDSHPHLYKILLDNTLLTSGPWNSSSEEIYVIITGLALGEHNYTVVVYDIDGNTAADSVIVSVLDQTCPSVSAPQDLTITEGNDTAKIVWTACDLHPHSYKVFRDGLLLQSGSWTSISQEIVISLADLEVGVHNFTIAFIDSSNNEGVDTVMVTVQSAITTTTMTTTTTTIETEEELPVLTVLLVIVLAIGGVLSIFVILLLERRTGLVSRGIREILSK